MLRTCSLLGLAALVGCASSTPVAPPPAAPPVRVIAPPPPPPPQPVEADIPEPAPVEPPTTPRLRVSQRSVFEEDRVVRWTLENGLIVFYAWDEGSRDYAALVTGPGGAGAPARSFVQPASTLTLTTADGIDTALRAAERALVAGGGDLSDAVVSLHGSLEPMWIEAAVAETLGRLPSRLAGSASTPPSGTQSSTEADWDDLGALAVLAALLEDRAAPSDRVVVLFDPEGGIVTVLTTSSMLPPARLLAPGADGAIRDARTRAARLAETGSGLAVGLGLLEHLPGRFQPARPPSDIRLLPSRIERTPPDRVNDLLRRLANALPE